MRPSSRASRSDLVRLRQARRQRLLNQQIDARTPSTPARTPHAAPSARTRSPHQYARVRHSGRSHRHDWDVRAPRSSQSPARRTSLRPPPARPHSDRPPPPAQPEPRLLQLAIHPQMVPPERSRAHHRHPQLFARTLNLGPRTLLHLLHRTLNRLPALPYSASNSATWSSGLPEPSRQNPRRHPPPWCPHASSPPQTSADPAQYLPSAEPHCSLHSSSITPLIPNPMLTATPTRRGIHTPLRRVISRWRHNLLRPSGAPREAQYTSRSDPAQESRTKSSPPSAHDRPPSLHRPAPPPHRPPARLDPRHIHHRQIHRNPPHNRRASSRRSSPIPPASRSSTQAPAAAHPHTPPAAAPPASAPVAVNVALYPTVSPAATSRTSITRVFHVITGCSAPRSFDCTPHAFNRQAISIQRNPAPHHRPRAHALRQLHQPRPASCRRIIDRRRTPRMHPLGRSPFARTCATAASNRRCCSRVFSDPATSAAQKCVITPSSTSPPLPIASSNCIQLRPRPHTLPPHPRLHLHVHRARPSPRATPPAPPSTPPASAHAPQSPPHPPAETRTSPESQASSASPSLDTFAWSARRTRAPSPHPPRQTTAPPPAPAPPSTPPPHAHTHSPSPPPARRSPRPPPSQSRGNSPASRSSETSIQLHSTTASAPRLTNSQYPPPPAPA